MEEFRKGYQNAIMQFQNKYNLKSKEASTEPQQTNPIRKPLVDTPSTRWPRPVSMNKDATEKAKSKEEASKKNSYARWEAGGK